MIVVGGSAGALGPLKRIVADLPADLPASVLVTIHMGRDGTSALTPILNRLGGPPAVSSRSGRPLEHAHIYVAVPDHHLELSNGSMRNTSTPLVNGVRPAIDLLFQSAAEIYGPRVVGVILSGGLSDGSAGLQAIREAGGVAIVQSDPKVSAMPRHAIETASPDHVATADEIGPLIVRIVNQRNGASRKKVTSSGHAGGIREIAPREREAI